jgi:hypothetical protein
MKRAFSAALVTAALAAAGAGAQMLTLPPSGDNQKSEVRQSIGLVEVGVLYSSPDVHAPDGTDRRGKIWGEGNLVPYGMQNLGFGTCGDQCPWRAGANENTVLTLSHDAVVEGQKVPAGRYGVHFVPGPEEWTLILSKNSTSWGSFFYDAKEDQLRAAVRPSKGEYREYLTWEFTERKGDRATLELAWEELRVPIRIEVPDSDELFFERVSQQLRSNPGFNWQAWQQAAQFLIGKKIHLDVAETWAKNAVDLQFIGQENFATLSTYAQAQMANGKEAEAKKTMDRAVAHPTAGIFDLHQYGRQLITQGRKDEALRIFELNAKRHPNEWPVHVGLARGYSAVGNYKKALEHAKLALPQAPDDLNKNSLTSMIEKLGKGEDVN